jgi:hypothetical protein
MTISIKHRSGGTLAGMLELAQLFHDNMADLYREQYAAVPVKVRKHRHLTLGGMLERRIMQLDAKRIVRERHA